MLELLANVFFHRMNDSQREDFGMTTLPLVYHRNGYELTRDEHGWLVRQHEQAVAGPFSQFHEAEREAKALPLTSWLGFGTCPSLIEPPPSDA